MLDIKLINAVEEARILGIFKAFCENNDSVELKARIRNILAISKNPINTIKEIIKREQKILLNELESKRVYELILAFLNKKSFRSSIDKETKASMLITQKHKCAICDCNIDTNYHLDHIVPFKYVGDNLENNLQLLCQKCNEAKKDSLDYQIKYLLKLI